MIGVGVISGIIALLGSLLQVALILEGLIVLGRSIVPFLYKEKSSWFALWGGWHLAVITLLLIFARGKFFAEMETFKQLAPQLEGLRILGMYLVLPLMVSFIISRVHLYIRDD